MDGTPSVAEFLDGHVALEVECLDCIYLNAYVPSCRHRARWCGSSPSALGKPIPSPALFAAIGNRFREDVKRFAMCHDIPLIRFGKDDRKIDVVRPYLQAAECDSRQGVVAVGVAQEFQNLFTGTRRPTAADKPVQLGFRKEDGHVTCFYSYVWDDDFGPALIKLCGGSSPDNDGTTWNIVRLFLSASRPTILRCSREQHRPLFRQRVRICHHPSAC